MNVPYPRASHGSIFNSHDHSELSFARSYPDSLRPDCTLSRLGHFLKITLSNRFVTQSIATGFTPFEADPPTVWPPISSTKRYVALTVFTNLALEFQNHIHLKLRIPGVPGTRRIHDLFLLSKQGNRMRPD